MNISLPCLALVALAACASPHTDGQARDLAALPDATPVADLVAGPVADATAPTVDSAIACGAIGQPCCAGNTCSALAYCHASACFATPTVTVMEPDGNVLGVVCADLDVVHVSPAYFVRVTIQGRPNAISYRYYKKTSCGNTMAQLVPDGAQTLDANGTYVFTIENPTADPSCTNGNIGVYEEWVVVDGVESVHGFSRVFSSGCAMYATCGAVSGACP